MCRPVASVAAMSTSSDLPVPAAGEEGVQRRGLHGVTVERSQHG